MGSMVNKPLQNVYKDILHTNNSNTGLSSTTRRILTGNGDKTAFQLSDRNVKIVPAATTTTTVEIYDTSGNSLLTVDSTNQIVKAGIGEHTVNTQYAHFGIGSGDSAWEGISAGNHYPVPFNGYSVQVMPSFGTSADPATSYTIATEGDDFAGCFLYVMDNISIDAVHWWSGADTATGDVTRVHLCSFDIVTGVGSTSGDLSNGTVHASAGSDITNSGYEQTYYQDLSVSSADVNAGKAIMFFFRNDTNNSDYSINATIKYHLR